MLKQKIYLLKFIFNWFVGSCFDYEENEEQLCSNGMCSLFYRPSDNEIGGECVDDDSMIAALYLTGYIMTDEAIYETEEENIQ